MSQPPDKIEPVAVDLSPAAAPAAAAAAEKKHTKLLLPVLLLLLAGFVVFALPALVPDTADSKPEPATQPATTPGNTTAAAKESSPWQEAQLAKQRKAAQDSLQGLLDLQFELEEQGLASWGTEAFAAVKALAADGDAAYQQRDYETAMRQYAQAQAQLQQIKDGLPERLQQLLEHGQAALVQGDDEAATALFEQALLIDAENAAAKESLAYAAVLDQVLALKGQADEAIKQQDWSSAEKLLAQAQGLYPGFPGLKEARQEAQASQLAENYNAAMGLAYARLNAADYAGAERQFRQALKLRPNDAQARAGVAQAIAEQDTRSIDQQMAKARQQVVAEEWEAADASYKKILSIDANLTAAQQQRALVKRRLQLDRVMQTTIADPLRLSDDKAYQAGSQLLQRAQKEKPRGPRLAQQIATLSELLQASQQTLPVQLQSDGFTDVILLRVARLGRFDQKSLALKPGNYTLLGSRSGYRDVRVAFSVRAGQKPGVIAVSAAEKI